jgi:molybdate transport system substrate-binding protein
MTKRLLMVLVLASCRSSAPAVTPLQVAAAADLKPAFEALGRTFTSRTGVRVAFTFGSTGLLATQLKEGAPFDLFAAASIEAAKDASSTGTCEVTTVTPYARGTLVVLGVSSLGALEDAQVKVIALAQPEHAPYGRAAKQALERAGLWDRVSPRVVYAQNVGQAQQYFATRNADAAFISRSLVMGVDAGVMVEVPAALHDPIEQAMVLCTKGSHRADAQRFADLVQSAEGQAVLAAAGFLPSGAKDGTNARGE